MPETIVPNLTVENFTCIRDDNALFAPLNFSAQAGEVVQIAGPNGAGKTTFLRAVSGLFSDWEGRILWNGQEMRVPDFELASELLYLGHQPGVKRTLTAKENILWYFGVHGQKFPGDVEAALAEVGLAGYEDVPCHQMSAGQMRRVALARLYVTEASIWILDEPFTAIDKKGVANLERLVVNHADRGGMILLTTHQALSTERVRLIELQRNRAVMV